MTKPKLWSYLVTGAVVLALGSAALGADTTDSNQDSSLPAALSHSSSASLPDQASAVATAGPGAPTPGAEPPTPAADGKAPQPASTHTPTTQQDASGPGGTH